MIRRPMVLGGCLLTLAVAAGSVLAQDLRAEAERYMAQQNLVRPGFGEDPGVPSGAPLRLPAGIAVSAPILGSLDPSECTGPAHGVGGAVQVCLPLCNTTGSSVRIRLPAGLTIVTKSASRYQNGILLEEVEVLVPPTPCGPGGIPIDEDPAVLEARGGPSLVRSAFSIALSLYCLNEERAPSEPTLPYSLGAVTDDADMLALIERARGLELDEDGVQVLQTAIYSITEGRGLTPADRAALATL